VVAHRRGGARESKPLEIAGVIDQAKKELDAKSRISFEAEPFKTGRKIQGWKIQSDRQQAKKRRTKGAVRSAGGRLAGNGKGSRNDPRK
jgi:hypothetical protein